MLNRTRYRGYILEVTAKGPQHEVHIEPSRPDVPILSRGSVTRGSAEEAVGEAERRIDRLLSECLIPA